MATTERHLRFGWIMPDMPNQFYGEKYRDISSAMAVFEDGKWIDGARLVDLGDSYHGRHTLMGVWWNEEFVPTREYYISILGRLPNAGEPLFEDMIQESLISRLI